MPVETLSWHDGALIVIDQTRLPEEVVHNKCDDVEKIAVAIEELQVRGAPAIGVAAAYGVVVGACRARRGPASEFRHRVECAIERLARTRPTAVNLFWALDQMREGLNKTTDSTPGEVCQYLEDLAVCIHKDDRKRCRRLGAYGAQLLNDGNKVITHCNAGALATADYGTALGVIYAAQEAGKTLTVFADETRPLLQGARLTAWELAQNGVEVNVICDNMAAAIMRREKIDCALVGADRIAGNGDVANKIGTYGLALIARAHNIPFYVAAPLSTVDMTLESGEQIPIEERREEEVSCGFGRRTVPEGIAVCNPAFDVTPNDLVTAIITERGIVRPPFAKVLAQWVEQNRQAILN